VVDTVASEERMRHLTFKSWIGPAVSAARIDATNTPLGTLARRIFAVQRRSALRQVHTSLKKNLQIRFRRILDLLRIEYFARRHAASVRRQRGLSIPHQLLQLLRLAVVHRIDPATYYAHHLYDAPLGIAESAYYLGRAEMKNGLYSLLRELRRGDPNFSLSLSDKVAFSTACLRAGLPIAPVLAVARGGRWEGPTPSEAFDGDLFVKPVRGRGAAAARAYRGIGDGHHVTADGTVLTRMALLDRIAVESQRMPLMVTRKLQNHPEIADLAAQSLITFRVFTCLDPTSEPVVTHAMLRTLSKLEPGWNTEEEFAAAIDLATGRLQPMCGDAGMAPDAWWDRHPKTGAPVTGRVIAHWPELAALAIRAHRAFSGRMIVGWDLALIPDGALVIEGNSDPDTHFLQRVHRCMIGRSALAPLLRHHLQAAESLLSGKPR
jgi:hypothetical protein